MNQLWIAILFLVMNGILLLLVKHCGELVASVVCAVCVVATILVFAAVEFCIWMVTR